MSKTAAVPGGGRGLALLVVVAWLASPADARQQFELPSGYEVTTWSIADGLPQNSVNGIVQAADGELWLATFGGLSRFDGVDFHNFDLNSTPEFPSQRLTALALGPDGDVWLATETDGVIRMRRSEVVETIPPAEAKGILSMAIDGTGRAWIQAGNGRTYRRRGDAWAEVATSNGPGRYSTLAAGSEGTIWAAAGRELVHVDSEGTTLERLAAPSPIHCIARAPAGACWVGLATSVGLAREGAIEICTIDPPLDSPVLAALPLDDARIFVGTRNGLQFLERVGSGSTLQARVVARDLPPDFGVRWLLLDHESNLWVGSINQGLARLTPHRVRALSTGAPPRPAVAVARAAGAEGTWVAGECTGVMRFDAAGIVRETIELPAEDRTGACAHSLLSDSRGRLWIGSSGAVLRWEHGALERTTLAVGSTRVTDIAEDAAGDFWIGSADGSLRRFGPDDSLLASAIVEGGIDALAPAADGSLWIGGKGRLTHVDGNERRIFGAAEGIPNADVRDILLDADGSVWLATYGGGLARLLGDRASVVTRDQGLSNASLSKVMEDRQGRVWMMSNAGLIVAWKTELLEVLGGSRARIDAVTLGPEAGVSEANHGSPAGHLDADGTMVFCTIDGGMRVDPGRFPFNRVTPHARVERMLCDERPLQLGSRPSVPALTRRLRFDYTAFALSAPRKVHFRYRLIGFDERWIEAGAARTAEYSTLVPGEYAFELLARNEHGVWSREPARLEFVVLPAWWQRSMVQVLGALLVAGALLAWHRARVAAVRRRGEMLLDANEGRRRAEAREWELREQLSHIGRVSTAGELATSIAHEVNQPLAAIVANASAAKRLLAASEPDRRELEEILRDIATQGERASEVIRRLREFVRKHETVRQDVSIARLLNETLPLVRRELSEHAVRLELDVGPDVPDVCADPIQLQQVFVNLIHNACDALSRVDRERSIVVRVRAEPRRVAIEVADNGPGLAPEVAPRLFNPYVTTKSGGMGLGLAICRTIVESHGGSLDAVPAEREGAVFRIVIPTESA